MKRNSINIQKNESKDPIRNRLYIATPTLGVVRAEWAQARWGAIIPCNWSCAGSFYSYSQNFQMGYLVAEAQNVAIEDAIRNNSEWILFIEDDVLIPPDLFLKLNCYMREAKAPIVSGLYYAKGNYPEPLIYRGRGNSYFGDFKPGDKIWCDGVPTGCLLVHMSIMRLMYDESPTYLTSFGRQVRKVFETPAATWKDPETGHSVGVVGTSDLYWCDRIIKDKILQRAGWKTIAKKQYPFLMDTSISCGHIDLTTGRVYGLK